MDLRSAKERIGVAGREYGGGPSEFINRLLPGAVDAEFERLKREWQARHPTTKEKFPWDEKRARTLAGRFVYGVAVGMVMAEDKRAMRELDAAYKFWRENL